MKKLGFTLAEVLITLVIIGVIAALTIGTVVSNTTKKQLEAKTKKFYTQFANAFETYKVNNGIYEFEDEGEEEFNFDDFAFNYLKVSAKCDADSDCFADEYSGRKTGKVTYSIHKSYAYKLDDGSVFSFDATIPPFKINFDVNGKDKPNKVGYDFWAASLHLDGRLDDFYMNSSARRTLSASEINEIINDQFESACDGENYTGCFGYFIRNGFKIVD